MASAAELAAQFSQNVDIPQNLCTARNLVENGNNVSQNPPNLNFGIPFQTGPILTIPKDSKLLFEPEINVKVEQPSPAPGPALGRNHSGRGELPDLKAFPVFPIPLNSNSLDLFFNRFRLSL